MSAQAIVDPSELRRFAQALKRFNSELEGSCQRINGEFRQLGDTWRDQKYHKFAQEFEQTLQMIQRFIRTSEPFIPFLNRQAQLIEEYLHHH